MCAFESTIDRWRAKAEDLRHYGAQEAACTLERCADELEDEWRVWLTEPLTLDEAGEESGYSSDHLGHLVREGTIPNAGEPHAPRIRRKDLPRKPGHSADPARRVDEPISSRVQMARSVVNSD